MDGCAFCLIAAGETDADLVALRAEHVFVLPALRQHPNNHGHTLLHVHVVPRFPDDHFVMTRAAVAEVPRPDRLRQATDMRQALVGRKSI
jgi:diadenosine tetraphosphate (Ap4A) HIT family hydrolase